MMGRSDQRGFTLVEFMVSIAVMVLALSGVAGLLIQNSQVNKREQMAAEVQANARNALEMVVAKLRSAGWDPMNAGIATVTLDPNTADTVSEIEVFADLDRDTFTTSDYEQIHIRHVNNAIVWRKTPTSAYTVVAPNISNDADGDGTIEPMFTPDDTTNPTRITVQITARSPAVDPVTKDFIRYTVSSDVVLRKEL